MSGNQFSEQELFHLRNNIPIAEVIKKLDIPSKISERYTRFLCPVCKEFNTSVNPKTNLARCFLCRKNYNPIDMVITVKGLPFRESVKYLQTLNDRNTPVITASPGNRIKTSLISMKEILNTSDRRFKPPQNKTAQQSDHQNHKELHEKIALLERQIKILTSRLSVLEQQILYS